MKLVILCAAYTQEGGRLSIVNIDAQLVEEASGDNVVELDEKTSNRIKEIVCQKTPGCKSL